MLEQVRVSESCYDVPGVRNALIFINTRMVQWESFKLAYRSSSANIYVSFCWSLAYTAALIRVLMKIRDNVTTSRMVIPHKIFLVSLALFFEPALCFYNIHFIYIINRLFHSIYGSHITSSFYQYIIEILEI